MQKKTIVFAVTNNLCSDQRMQRICTTLQSFGYNVTLVGVKIGPSPTKQSFNQKRLFVPIKSGFLFYACYNIALFFYLLLKKVHIIGAVDLDTILPCYLASKIKNTQRVYDAHEYFTELKEVVTRPRVQRVWLKIAQFCVPKFANAYTVSNSIANDLQQAYGVPFTVIKNVPYLQTQQPVTNKPNNVIIYQGAINQGRGLEFLLPAMQSIKAQLYLYGTGNFYTQCQALIVQHQLQNKVFLKGVVTPTQLQQITQNATIGVNLVEPIGKNQLYSLANKFFDYMHAGLPQVTMDFIEYKNINKKYHVAILINKLTVENLVTQINLLLNNTQLLQQLGQNCVVASRHFNWQTEQEILKNFYNNLGANNTYS
jgi:glycosyltransferase involved in cell wall biosynthesis